MTPKSPTETGKALDPMRHDSWLYRITRGRTSSGECSREPYLVGATDVPCPGTRTETTAEGGFPGGKGLLRVVPSHGERIGRVERRKKRL